MQFICDTTELITPHLYLKHSESIMHSPKIKNTVALRKYLLIQTPYYQKAADVNYVIFPEDPKVRL